MFRKILAATILVGLTAEANAALSTGDLAFVSPASVAFPATAGDAAD